MGAAAAAAVAGRIRHIIRAFQDGRATSPNSARSLADLRVDHGMLVRRLRENGVIREASPGTFYLDEAALAAWQQRQRTIAATILALVMLGLLAAALYVWFTQR
ncbi:MAG TPA: hypothetical protein VGI83_00765 [Gemmatimonadales bacterium]